MKSGGMINGFIGGRLIGLQRELLLRILSNKPKQ